MSTESRGNYNSNRKMNIKNNYTRRRFVSSFTAAGAALTLPGLNYSWLTDPLQSQSRKIHVFSKPLQWLGYDDTAAIIAEAGAEGIDLSVRPGGHVLPENVETDLPKAYEAARRHGLSMDMIVTGITAADEKYTESILRTASKLGIKYYRMGWIGYDETLGVWGTLQKYRVVFRKLEELNMKYGIHGAYQNHSGTRIGGPVWDLYELLKDMDPQYIGVQYDVRHAIVEGGSSWINGLKLLTPWIRCTDIKDFKWVSSKGKWNPETVPLGEGMVYFDEYFRYVKKSNIGGPVSLHLEYPPFERFTEKITEAEKRKLFLAAMKKDVDKLKEYFTKYQL
jgi:sugar phosphate isomerase/epimerase